MTTLKKAKQLPKTVILSCILYTISFLFNDLHAAKITNTANLKAETVVRLNKFNFYNGWGQAYTGYFKNTTGMKVQKVNNDYHLYISGEFSAASYDEKQKYSDQKGILEFNLNGIYNKGTETRFNPIRYDSTRDLPLGLDVSAGYHEGKLLFLKIICPYKTSERKLLSYVRYDWLSGGLSKTYYLNTPFEITNESKILVAWSMYALSSGGINDYSIEYDNNFSKNNKPNFLFQANKNRHSFQVNGLSTICADGKRIIYRLDKGNKQLLCDMYIGHNKLASKSTYIFEDTPGGITLSTKNIISSKTNELVTMFVLYVSFPGQKLIYMITINPDSFDFINTTKISTDNAIGKLAGCFRINNVDYLVGMTSDGKTVEILKLPSSSQISYNQNGGTL